MSSDTKAELAALCSSLGHFRKGEYMIEPDCNESIKDLIRYLKRDDESHYIRRCLGEIKVLQNDLLNIIKNCPSESTKLFNITLRLLINLITPTQLLYGEELPNEKAGRNIYLSLLDLNLGYKIAFCDEDFWNKVCGTLTNLFEMDSSELSDDENTQIDRIFLLIRNILKVPTDLDKEERPEISVTIHDKILWVLRQSQILELLLLISSEAENEQYYLCLLEIFSLILKDQNPKRLAQCGLLTHLLEIAQDTKDLVQAREVEKLTHNKYVNRRNFNGTYVVKGVKSLSDYDVVCHKSLDKAMDVSDMVPKKEEIKVKKKKIPVESEKMERQCIFSVRLFLKEFTLEFLNTGFNYLIKVVNRHLESGNGTVNDQSYYFWALQFFLDFAVASDLEVSLVKNCLSTEVFHFVHRNLDRAFENLCTEKEKEKATVWLKRIHLAVKAYQSLLKTLEWLDHSKNPLTRAISREIKSEIFYIVEYREMIIRVLLKYDETKFSVSFLRDWIETTHLFVKLLEGFSKEKNLVEEKIDRKIKNRNKKRNHEEIIPETKEEKWDKIEEAVYDSLFWDKTFPEIPPFDAALDIPIDDQKSRAMVNIQKLLHEGKFREGIGMLRSARQVWPENDYFGSPNLSYVDETMVVRDICLADLQHLEGYCKENEKVDSAEKDNNEGGGCDDDDDDDEYDVGWENIIYSKKDFDILEYKKGFVNKKVVEGCGVLLKNYYRNSEYTNHCAIKLLHRIGWECNMPAMLYQASLFWTLDKIMKDKRKKYDEINIFAKNLIKRFRKHSSANPIVFLELLFWKDRNVALEIQHGYESYEDKKNSKNKRGKKSKNENLEMDEVEILKSKSKREKKRKPRKVKKEKANSFLSSQELDDCHKANLLEDLKYSDYESYEDEFEKLKSEVHPEKLLKESEEDKKNDLNLDCEFDKDICDVKGVENVKKNLLNKLNKVGDVEKDLELTNEKKDTDGQIMVQSDGELFVRKSVSKCRLVISSDEEEMEAKEGQNSSSESWVKKRRRNQIVESEDSDDDMVRRPRYVDSDSEVDSHAAGRKKKRKTLTVIDSESEPEN